MSCYTLFFFIVVNSLSWIANSIFFWQMSLSSIWSPVFLLWFTLIPYVVILLPLLGFRKFRGVTTWRIHLLFFGYAILSITDSYLEILSSPRISGMTQNILSATIPIPTVGILAWVILKQRFTRWEIFGTCIVLAASIIQITSNTTVETGSSETEWYWALVFTVGILFGSAYTILWEIAFSWYQVSPISLLIWSTLYSIPLYGCLTLIYILNGSDQLLDIKCFFGILNSTLINSTIPNETLICSPNAWIAVTGYSLTSILTDLVQLYLVAFDTAFFLTLSDVLSTPIISLIFALPLFGSASEPLTWQSIVSTVLTVLGLIVYKAPIIFRRCLQKTYIV